MSARVLRRIGAAVMLAAAAGLTVLFLYARLPFGATAAGIGIAALAAFFLLNENAPFDEKRIIAVAVMTAAAVAGRAAFYFVPHFKPILAVVILCGAYLGCGSGFLCGALSVLLSNFLFGQGPWTIFQMCGAGLAGFVAGLLKRAPVPVLAVWGALAAYLYCIVADVWTLYSLGTAVTVRAWLAVTIAGLPSATILAAGTVVFIVALALPFKRKFDRLRTRYGIGR